MKFNRLTGLACFGGRERNDRARLLFLIMKKLVMLVNRRANQPALGFWVIFFSRRGFFHLNINPKYLSNELLTNLLTN